MNISESEKLTLLMLCDLYKKLEIEGKDNEGYFDSKLIHSAIDTDNAWAIAFKYSHIFRDSDRPEYVLETESIMAMWEHIERSYASLSCDDKEELVAKIGNKGDNPTFMGFDTNNESLYHSAASFFVKELKLFPTFNERSLCAIEETVNQYNGMVRTYNNLDPSSYGRDLSLEELALILGSEEAGPFDWV